MSSEHQGGTGKPLDPKKLLREAIAGGDADFASSGWQPPPVEQLGKLFPELDVVELIGRGGMGAVYRVVQRKLDRTVALKVLPPELATDPAFEERFLREARALAGLKHARILTVHDFGERDGLYYLVTEFVEGMNLRQLMDMGELSPHEALRITPQICEALQFAHDHGVVHRDIKPENLLIDLAGEVRIADFGLARILNDDPAAIALTRSTQVLGTPQYMAPEQWRHGALVDHRADIYAVGVVLYEMLTGQLPLGHFDPPSHRDGVPKGLDAVVQRSLAQRPEQRYQRASDVSDELVRHAVAAPPRRAGADRSDTAHPETRAGVSDSKSRQPAPWTLTMAWAVIVMLAFGVATSISKVNAETAQFEQQSDAYQYVYDAAQRWARKEQKDGNSPDLLTNYYEEKVWPDWDRRRAQAMQAGQAMPANRPQVPEEPIEPRGLSITAMVIPAAPLFVLIMLFGFAAVRSVRKARRGTAWLGLSIFTAWIIPVVVVAAVPIAMADTIEDPSLRLGALVVGVCLGVGGIVMMFRHRARLAAEISG